MRKVTGELRMAVMKATHKMEDAARKAADINTDKGNEVCANIIDVWEDLCDLAKVLLSGDIGDQSAGDLARRGCDAGGNI